MKYKVLFTIFVALTITGGYAIADQKVTMAIDGMTCKLWPLAIKKSLSGTEGVKKAEVSYEQSKAWIIISEETQEKALIEAVSRVGPYKAKIIGRETIEWHNRNQFKRDIMVDETYKQLRELSPKVTGGLIRMREATFVEGAVSSKYKILAALSIVVATKCEPCIIGYTKMAHQAGATIDELVEFLNVAITEAGCPAEQWALKALETYNNLDRGEVVDVEICCHE